MNAEKKGVEMKNRQAVDNALAGLGPGDATSSIHYTIRILARNTEYNPKTNNFLVKGLNSEPSPKQRVLSKRILSAIEEAEGRPIAELPVKDSSRYIRLLSGRLEGLQKPNVSPKQAAILLAGIRQSPAQNITSSLLSATLKAGAVGKKNKGSSSGPPSATLKAGAVGKSRGRA